VIGIGSDSLPMFEAAKYFTVEQLRGNSVVIRALRPDDQAQLIAAVNRTSSQSMFRRFFAAKRGFTGQEIAFFVNVDFVGPGPLFNTRRAQLVTLVAYHKVPAIFSQRETAEAGGLMSYGLSLTDAYAKLVSTASPSWSVSPLPIAATSIGN
jgi:hypothetical protein